ncbi:MAG: hypothetical protein ACRDTN_15350, partial [Mycobacterium sp.]
MFGQRPTKRSRQPLAAKAHRRRVAGLLVAFGAFLGFGMAPLATAPRAHADDIDLLLDPIIASVQATMTELDPAGLAASVDPFAGAADAAAAAWFDQAIYLPLHADIETWINSTLGQAVDGFINGLFGQYLLGDGAAGTALHPEGGNAGLLLGDGGTGFGYSCSGGNAGWLLGDGGNAGDAAAVGTAAGGTDGTSGAAAVD